MSKNANPLRSFGLALSLVAIGLSGVPAAFAANAPKHTALGAKAAKTVRAKAVTPTQPTKDAALVVDATTGRVLYERNSDAIRYPASLTKMMTLYLLFDALQKGVISMDSKMVTSAHAAAQAPTKLYLAVGESIPVETAIKAIVVRSANDVAVVIAEALGGTEAGFAQMMTAKAHQLGMAHTNFHNASGLPDPLQTTTASDLALLARHLAYDFSSYYHYFSINGFSYKGRVYLTHDNLLAAFNGTDGIKTGYTQMSGFNLVTSAIRNGKHIIGVVMGGRTAATRDAEMMRLLGQAFTRAKEDPTLVADANVPWLNGPGPKTRALWGETPGTIAVASAGPKNDAVFALQTNVPAGAATTAATLTETPTPGEAQTVAAATPEIEQGDADGPSLPAANLSNLKQWAIQIGAFADRATAQAELVRYAQRSFDLIGQSLKLIVPLATTDGHMLYRARFGLFAETDARTLCKTMASRGQACFALKSE